MAKDRKSSSKSQGVLGSTIVLTALGLFAVVLILWSYVEHQRSLLEETTEDIPSKRRNNGVDAQYEHVEKLFEQTKALMRDITSHTTNISLSQTTKEEMESLRSERILVHKEIEGIQNQKNKAENNFAHCVAEKYRISEDYEKCQSSLERALSKIDSSSSSSSSSLTSIDNADFLDINLTSFNNLQENPRRYGLRDSTIPAVDTTSISLKWLVIGIPTISRPHNEDYLLKSLHKIASQLPHDPLGLFYGQVLVAIVNVEGRTHKRFYEAKDYYSKDKNLLLSQYFLFEELSAKEQLPDPKHGATDRNDPGNANVPGYRVRRQSRNLVSVVRKVSKYGKYYMFLEDDMEFCPQGFIAIQTMLDKASRYHSHWLAIRASYGMNGIFMAQKDVNVFADYLLKHHQRRPPDHLVVEWYAGETPDSRIYKGQRVNIGYRYNLFNHIGHISTLRAQPQTTFPLCYDFLLEPTVFLVEAFNPKDCPHDDIWPCKVDHPDKTFIHWENFK